MIELPSVDELIKLSTPMPLTDDELNLLSDFANRLINDDNHRNLCGCDAWPEKCISTGNYFMGAWDTSVIEEVLRQVLGAWATLNTRHLSGLAMANPGVKLIDERGLALGEVATVNSNLRNSINEAVEGLVKILADLRNA